MVSNKAPFEYPNHKILVWQIYKDLNASFINRGLHETEPLSRFYNFLWIFRWGFTVLLIGILYEEKRTTVTLVCCINLLFLIYTIVAFIRPAFLNPIVGSLLILEEVLLFIFSVIGFWFWIAEQWDENKLSFTIVWLMSLVLMFCFFGILLIELALAGLGLFAAFQVENDSRENYVPNQEDYNFKVDEEDLDVKVRKY